MGPFWVAACVAVGLAVAAMIGAGVYLAYRRPRR
jgi:hypothetical protein